MKTFSIYFWFVFCFSLSTVFTYAGGIQIPVSATMTTEMLGESKGVATNCVYRIVRKDGKFGTGFLHKSGKIITAAHVVDGASLSDIGIMTPMGIIAVTNLAMDQNLDIALLAPAIPITAPSFSINTNDVSDVGAPVITWGYPAGYSGMVPLLSAGSVSGFQEFVSNGTNINRMVVNAAFNSGNSGGPLLDVESHTVIGIVVSKMAPIPPNVQSEIDALKNNSYGMMYNGTDSSGKTVTVSEAKILADVIEYLRSQVQLVIGYAVPAKDLRKFLKQQGIDP